MCFCEGVHCAAWRIVLSPKWPTMCRMGRQTLFAYYGELIVFDSGRTALASSFPADILLYGSGINKCHCYLVVDGGTVTIHPLALLTSIDGVNVSSPTSLHHGKVWTISVVTELSVWKFFSLNCYIWWLKNQQKTFVWPISATVPVSSVISDILLLTI